MVAMALRATECNALTATRAAHQLPILAVGRAFQTSSQARAPVVQARTPGVLTAISAAMLLLLPPLLLLPLEQPRRRWIARRCSH